MSRIFNASSAASLPVSVPDTSLNLGGRSIRNKAGAFVNSLRNPVERAKVSAGLFGGLLKGVFYLVAGIFVIFLVLLVIHFMVTPIFKFSPDDKGILQVPTPSDALTAWTQGPPAYTDAAGLQTTLSCGYTIAMDVYDTGEFRAMTAPRVLLYRNTTPVTLPIDMLNTSEMLLTKFSRTNLLVMLNPITNDLVVGAVTQSDAAGPMTLELCDPIQNTPVKTPFRIAVVFTSTLLEVYMNGKLVATKALTGNVIQSTYDFYPPTATVQATDTVPSSVKVGNLSVWNRVLSVAELRIDGTPISGEKFFLESTAR